jgi:YesN/AraC family two-component response regulator
VENSSHQQERTAHRRELTLLQRRYQQTHLPAQFPAVENRPDTQDRALFEAIRDYIDERYASALTRESVAQAFYISPNYLSHLFQKTGAIGFNEYLNHTRLEHAKTLLKGYDLKVKEVAHACGFVDSNYFCRLFRKNTERSPSEYRRQYHSQLTEKPTTPE